MASMKAGFAYACALLCIIVASATPALADDADLKKQVEQMVFVYGESYNKQDAATIAAQYATGGLIVTPAGARNVLSKCTRPSSTPGSINLKLRSMRCW